MDAATTAPEFSHLRGIIVTHSHHDHAMDVGEVANKFSNAAVIGSKSTRNILDGWARWRGMVPGGRDYCPLMARFYQVPDLDHCHCHGCTFGAFKVTMLAGTHAKTLFSLIEAKQIDQQLEPPNRISDYAAGEVYIVHVAHAKTKKSLVFVGSAGIPAEGASDGLKADVVFLAVAAMPLDRERDRYLDRTIGTLQPRAVIPIHWDSQFDKSKNDDVVEPSG